MSGWISRLPWVLRLLWQPERELDLSDAAGRPDHSKRIGFVAFAVFVGLAIAGKLPPLGHTIAMLSVVFGWIGWRTFLKSRTATASETVLEQRLVTSEPDAYADDERGEFVERERV